VLANAVETELGLKVTFVHTKDFVKYDPTVVIKTREGKEAWRAVDIRKLPKMEEASGLNHALVREAVQALSDLKTKNSKPEKPPTAETPRPSAATRPQALMDVTNMQPAIVKTLSPVKPVVAAPRSEALKVKPLVVVEDMDF
jgi:hypothetical protein